MCRNQRAEEMGGTNSKASAVVSLFLGGTIAAGISSCGVEKPASPGRSRPEDVWPVDPRSAELDLNDDGIVDFRFGYQSRGTDDVPMSSLTWYLFVTDMGENEHQGLLPEGTIPLPDSTWIDGAVGWSHYPGWLAAIDWNLGVGWDATWSGPWAGAQEKNLALKLVGDATHYGWVKLSVATDKGTLTIHDHAYQSVPGAGILAGVPPVSE
jgi:hypothetical protein